MSLTNLGCLPFTWANWSVRDLDNWYPKFRTGTFRPGFAFTICTNRGSCIICAPLGRVWFGTIGQYVDRLLIAISVDCRLTCCWTLDRYVGQCIGRHISWHVGWHSTACRLGQLSCNIICALKSEWGSWVSVLHSSHTSLQCHINLLDFCHCSTCVIMLDCFWIPFKRWCHSGPYFFPKKKLRTLEIILSHL